MIVAIVAHDYNLVIGKGNDLPWRLSEDLKLFKKITTGHVVVMGRKTWDSIPDKYRPLPNRLNIVLTRGEESCSDDPDGPIFINKWEDVLSACPCPNKHIFVIGGASIYDYTINEASVKVDRILLSLVDGVHEGDVFFPKLKGTWADVHVSSHEGFSLIEKIRYETCIP